MAIVDDDIERIRSTVSIVDVVSQQVQLRKTGRNWVGLCPFHAEKTPSFNVREETGRYKCFGCDASGDVFTFVQEIDHVDFVGAVEQLAAKAGIQLTYTTTGHSKERARRKQLVDAMATAVDWYHDRLLNDPGARTARDYLRSRGLAGDVARTFKIGWAPDDWDALSRGAGIAPDLLRDNGLAFSNRSGRLQDAFRARVLFPIFNENGEPVGVGGRILPGSTDPAKYKNSPETPIYTKSKTLYGLNWAKGGIVAADQAIVCEGYTDVIGFHRAGLPCAVATCGTAFTEEHVRLLKRYAKPRRAGVRRRRGWPGRSRTVLRMGAEVPGRGQRGAVSRGEGPGGVGAVRPGGSRGGRRVGAAVPRLPARPGAPGAVAAVAGAARSSRRGGDDRRQRASELERPQVVCRPGRGPGRAAGRRSRTARRAGRASPAGARDGESIAPRTAGERRVRGDHAARAGLELDRSVDGRIAVRRRVVPPRVPRHRGRIRRPGSRLAAGRPRSSGGARTGGGGRPRGRCRGRGAQPDRAPRCDASSAVRHRRRIRRSSWTIAMPVCDSKTWGYRNTRRMRRTGC